MNAEPSTLPKGERFAFGKNWASFLSVLDDERIAEACKSLRQMLGVESLAGRSFVDIGSGSGLFSLAAMRLGAARVHSFDYDRNSVECTRVLKERYYPGADQWVVEQGNALDRDYLGKLGRFDVVYSWGVLHHTGKMWEALENATLLVRDGGVLFIAIYRDQGFWTRFWTAVKRAYNRGAAGRAVITAVFFSYFFLEGLLADLVRLRNPVSRYAAYKKSRGMSRVHDWIDWIGGWPFEVATPAAVFDFYKKRGFHLENLFLRYGHGCNELVFSKTRVAPSMV